MKVILILILMLTFTVDHFGCESIGFHNEEKGNSYSIVDDVYHRDLTNCVRFPYFPVEGVLMLNKTPYQNIKGELPERRDGQRV